MMEMKWQENGIPKRLSRHERTEQLRQFVEGLKERPGVWAEYKICSKGKTFNSHPAYRRFHPGTDWACRMIDGQIHVYGVWAG